LKGGAFIKNASPVVSVPGGVVKERTLHKSEPRLGDPKFWGASREKLKGKKMTEE